MPSGYTYAELRDLAEALAELEGYTDAVRRPNWGKLVNEAYVEFCWETACIREEDANILTVAGQAEYVLSGAEWRFLLDVMVDETTLERVSEASVRRAYPDWLRTPAGLPSLYWRPRPKLLRLYPRPAEGGKTVRIYGIRAPKPLYADSDVPEIPSVYHESLAQRAYFMAAQRWARGDGRQALLDQIDQYLKKLSQLRDEFGSEQLYGLSREVREPIADRVWL